MPLDFSTAVALFLSNEQELAAALRISIADLRAYRASPASVPAGILARLGEVLLERGQGMQRVGQMLADHDA